MMQVSAVALDRLASKLLAAADALFQERRVYRGDCRFEDVGPGRDDLRLAADLGAAAAALSAEARARRGDADAP